jgi:hypothetical protein
MEISIDIRQNAQREGVSKVFTKYTYIAYPTALFTLKRGV